MQAKRNTRTECIHPVSLWSLRLPAPGATGCWLLLLLLPATVVVVAGGRRCH